MGRKLRMSEQKTRVVAIGEVMVEMARGSDGRFGMACGGDTFNTAIYLARAGIDVAYATALGDDPYSDGIVSLATAEGIKTDLMLRVPGRQPGLYMIETTPRASGASATGATRRRRANCSNCPTGNTSPRAMLAARLIYFSGITLSLYSNTGLGRFLAIIEMARQQGAKSPSTATSVRRLERRSRAHPHRVYGGTQARRHRAADLRRRGGAVG